jgi:hypothetical protein
MNQAPTTVELLQQQQSLPLQTTSNSLKRNSQSVHPHVTTVYPALFPVQQTFNNEPPRKRQNSESGSVGNRKENRDGNEYRQKAYPSPPPSVLQISLEGDQVSLIPPKPVQPVTKWSLVLEFALALLTVVSSSMGTSPECY